MDCLQEVQGLEEVLLEVEALVAVVLEAFRATQPEVVRLTMHLRLTVGLRALCTLLEHSTR